MGPASGERPLLELHDRAEWRRWLERNHGSCAGVRVAVGKKGSTVTRLTYEDAVLEALAFGWIDSKALSLDAGRWAQTFAPRRRGSNWSRSNKERVERLLAEGLMAPAGLAAVEAARAGRVGGAPQCVSADSSICRSASRWSCRCRSWRWG